MKYLLLSVLLFCLTGCSRLIPNEIESGKLLGVMPMQYGRVSYQVNQSLATSREDVFRQARRWSAFHMYNPASSLSVSDNMLGDVITRGIIDGQIYRTKSGPQ